METTGGPSLYDPLDSQGRSHPTRSRSRSAVPPSAPESQIRENIEMMEISSDECEEIIPPRKKSRRAGVNVPRKGKGPAKGVGRLEQVVAVEKKKFDDIQERLTCAFCLGIMWVPYRLTECGHLFCLRCLLAWFEKKHVDFLRANPGYAPLSPMLKEALGRPLDLPRECVQACAVLLQSPTRPVYGCPSCGADVTRRPIKDLKMQEIVRIFGSVQGLNPPAPGLPVEEESLGRYFLL